MAVAPRNRITGSLPGAPLPWITRAPATLPSSPPSAPTAGAWFSWLASTRLTSNVRFFFSVAPAVPVTTTSLSVNGSNCNWKSCVWVPGVSVICFVPAWYPMLRARSVTVCPLALSAGTVRV